MTDQNLSREQLIFNLFALQQKYDLLKQSIESDQLRRRQEEQALREDKERYRSILHASPDAIAITGLDGFIVLASPAALKMFGYDHEEELIGSQISDAILPGAGNRALHTGVPGSRQRLQGPDEYRGLRKNGSLFDIEVNSEVILDAGGEPVRKIFIARDITDRKSAEEYLRQTRQNYETFFNTIDEFLFVLDEQGNILHTNSIVVDRLGYSTEELTGKSVLLVHPPARREEAGRIVGEMLQGLTEFCPVPLMTKSGVMIPVETRVSPGFWDGKPVIFGVTKDISKLRFSEEKFSKLFYLNPSACGLSDLGDQTYFEVNEAFYTLFGFDRHEVIGKTAMELGILTEEGRKAILSKADQDGNVMNTEVELVAKNGEVKHVLLSAGNVHVQDKAYRFTFVHDMTGRKRSQDALRESELRYRTLFQTSPSGIMVLDEHGVILEANSVISRTTQYSYDELIGNNILVLSDSEKQQKVTANIQQILQGESLEQEVVNRKKDGTRCTFLLRETAITLPDGRQGILSVSNDITERKRAEEALKESERRFKKLFEGHNAIMLQIEPGTGRILDANDAAAAFYGYRKEELRTLHIHQINTLTEEQIRIECDTAISENRNYFILSHRLAGGEERMVEVHSSPIELQEKKILFSIIHDITERQRAEAEILEKNEELVRLNAEKDKFFSIIAHDLRSPFNSFLGLTQVLAEDMNLLSKEEIQLYAQSMRSSAVNLYRLLENLLEWSMLQRGLTRFEKEPFILKQKITECLLQIMGPARIKNIELTYEIPDDIEIEADTHMFETMIRNLVSNAVKFTPKGGRVSISAQPASEGYVEISVRDNGIGMSKHIISNLFNIDTPTNRKGTEGERSTGLGLIICRDFIEQHGGKIRVHSEESKGSTFSFSLATSKIKPVYEQQRRGSESGTGTR